MSKMDIYVTNDNNVVRIDNGDGTHTAVYYEHLKDEDGLTNERLTNSKTLAWSNRGEPVWTAPKPGGTERTMTETGKLYVNKDRTLLLWVSPNDNQQITALEGKWLDDQGLNPNDGTWDEISLPSKPFEPLDIPEEGRKIKATLRSGETVTTVVKTLGHSRKEEYILFEYPPGLGGMFLNLTDVADEDENDIMEWEYVKEWVNDEAEVYTPEGDWHAVFSTVRAAQEYIAMKNGEK